MTIAINRLNANDCYLEIGAGEHPTVHPRCLGGPDVATDCRPCCNEAGQQVIDFQLDVEQVPWPVRDSEFDGLVAVFCLEHVSYVKISAVLKECLRVIKPGCKAVFALPNTDAQLRWIQTHPEGWDGKPAFESMSEVLFGTQGEQTAAGHQSYWNPAIVERLFTEAGFAQVKAFPYGERATDLVIEAHRPANPVPKMVNLTQEQYDAQIANWPGQSLNLSGEPPAILAMSERIPPNNEVCGAGGPGGIRCGKPKGHEGKHAAQI